MESAIVQEPAEALFTVVAATGAAAVRARGYGLSDLCQQETGLGKGGGVGPMVGEESAPLLDLAFRLAGRLRHGSHNVYGTIHKVRHALEGEGGCPKRDVVREVA